ncbi:glycoprotein-N-acetylgalactosamine 3-beta-galactosyltransferase 1-like [Onthophagus taurus]|uniref:glycoprotein-N-acetylgalactosamine 3-beta-galactosyltransferase 1-like n=1 Tax=Onthophagus taurus TaxID=166361 RepID=UPI0039BE3CA5
MLNLTDIKIHLIILIFGVIIGIVSILFYINQTNQIDCSSKINHLGLNRNGSNQSVNDRLKNQMKILCWVMTCPQNHYLKAFHVKQTWGKRCDVLLFMSSKKDESLPAIGLEVKEGREHLWEKSREAFKYLYKYYLNDIDWFIKADDDTYVIIENLRLLLRQYDPKKAYFLGSLIQQKRVDLAESNLKYMYGGSGYVLSKETLRKYIEESLNDPNLCFNPDVEKNEDMYIGKCLENVGVKMVYTHDDFGRERFLHNHLINIFKEWGVNKLIFINNRGTGK